MFPARRTDPAHEQALSAALDRLTGGAQDRADNPDGWITTIRGSGMWNDASWFTGVWVP